MAERTVVVDGFSKAYAMTGWRLGYGLLPAGLVGPVAALLANSASCTATFVQHAGVAALTGPQELVAAQAAEFRRRRDWLVAALNAVDGVRCPTPGARSTCSRASRACSRPGAARRRPARPRRSPGGCSSARRGARAGTAFGPAGVGHLRLAYTASREDLGLAVERIRECVAGWDAG
jgi:aspartate/methionine/tyrosine aminotransferase